MLKIFNPVGQVTKISDLKETPSQNFVPVSNFPTHLYPKIPGCRAGPKFLTTGKAYRSRDPDNFQKSAGQVTKQYKIQFQYLQHVR